MDEIPAAIKGNIYNVNDDEKFVYGFVEFVLPDTSRTFVNGLNLILPNACDIEFYCPHPSTPGIAANPCTDCLVLEGATYEKPDYFK